MDKTTKYLLGGAALAGVVGLYLLTRGGNEEGGAFGGGGRNFAGSNEPKLEPTKKEYQTYFIRDGVKDYVGSMTPEESEALMREKWF